MDYNSWNALKIGEKACPRAGSNPGILNLVVSKAVRYVYATLIPVDYRLKLYVYIFSSLHLQILLVC